MVYNTIRCTSLALNGGTKTKRVHVVEFNLLPHYVETKFMLGPRTNKLTQPHIIIEL